MPVQNSPEVTNGAGTETLAWYWDERGGWYVTVGKRRRLLAKGPKAGAKKEADREFHRLMLAEGRPAAAETSRLEVRDLLDRHLLHLEDRVKQGEMEEATYRNRRRILTSAAKSFGDRRTAAVAQKDVLAWTTRDSWGPSMRFRAIADVATAFGPRRPPYRSDPVRSGQIRSGSRAGA